LADARGVSSANDLIKKFQFLLFSHEYKLSKTTGAPLENRQHNLMKYPGKRYDIRVLNSRPLSGLIQRIDDRDCDSTAVFLAVREFSSSRSDGKSALFLWFAFKLSRGPGSFFRDTLYHNPVIAERTATHPG
jgi:hypothetical protein